MENSKVFIDTDTEITFVLEKILNSKSDRIALVVPDRASLLSTITGLKLLKQVVDKSNKLLVLVTLDNVGATLARNAGLFVVSRVGEIHEEIWEKVQKAKFEVIKKSQRTHYIPQITKESIEASAKHLENVHEQTSEHIQISDLIKPLDEPDTNFVESLDETSDLENLTRSTSVIDSKDIPQVRVNINLEDLKRLEEAQKESEGQDTFLTAESPNATKEIEMKPIPSDEAENNDSLSAKEKSSVMYHEHTPEDHNRLRKTVSRRSGISNLSFAVGKDVRVKKKRIRFW